MPDFAPPEPSSWTSRRWSGWPVRMAVRLLATALAGMRALLPGGGDVATASEWAERFLALWTAAGWPGDRTLNSDEQQTLAKLNEALSGFGGLDDLLGTVSFRTACAQFQQWASSTAYRTADAVCAHHGRGPGLGDRHALRGDVDHGLRSGPPASGT